MENLDETQASPLAGRGGAVPGGSGRECGETYCGELLRFGRYRVAICRDGRQWLYQRQRRRFAGGGTAWDTLGYFTTRTALIRLHRSLNGAGAESLRTLPETFAGERADERST